jgi:hypothetical protein
MELITVLARKLALADAQAPGATGQANAREAHPDASVATIPVAAAQLPRYAGHLGVRDGSCLFQGVTERLSGGVVA